MTWTRKDLLHIEGLTASEIKRILDTAKPMKDIMHRTVKKLPTFRGKSVINLFFESSTRTRSSFETAAKILGADTSSLAVAQSSVNKGETLLDTVRTLQAMNPDIVVIRHASFLEQHILSLKKFALELSMVEMVSTSILPKLSWTSTPCKNT